MALPGDGDADDGAPQTTQDLTIFVRGPSFCCSPLPPPRQLLTLNLTLTLTPTLARARSQVQNLLQQMQGRFSTMSDAIIGRSACLAHPPRPPPPLLRPDLCTLCELGRIVN